VSSVLRCAITGGHGFLGWHLRSRLLAEWPDAHVRVLGRGDLDDRGELAERLRGCDVVFHFAAADSFDERAVQENIPLAESLVAALDAQDRPPRVVFSNSKHSESDTPYGRAKRATAELLHEWAERSGGTFADVLLPNLFGECGRPHHNSAVATLCHAIARREACEVNPDGHSELLHAQDAAVALMRYASGSDTIRERVSGETIQITDLYARLVGFRDVYEGTHAVPPLPTLLDLRLFNQLRVAMFPAAYPVSLRCHADARGAFFEAVRDSGGGQASFSTTSPGVTRGNHWHFDKIERFLVLQGRAMIRIRRVLDHTVHSFSVSGGKPEFVDMPTLHTHSITNIGDDELLTMFWSNDHFDPAAPDTFPEPVQLGGQPS